MAGSPGSLFRTLQTIMATKMREQAKRRKAFETRKAKIFDDASDSEDERTRLETLITAFQDLSMSNKDAWYADDDRTNSIRNVTRYLELSSMDPSVSSKILRKFEKDLREKLDQESQRFNFADLYYELLAEWTNANSKPIVESEPGGGELDGSFEHLMKDNLENLRERFAEVAFTPLETDEAEIDSYMNTLFKEDHAKTHLDRMRHEMEEFAKELKERKSPFGMTILKQIIEALLTNDLLNDDARVTLTDFLSNDSDSVLDEIANVLNLRFSDIESWSWDAEDGMYCEPRRQINGKYRIMMDEDVLQAIFLHYVASCWCAKFNAVFTRLPYASAFWKSPKGLSEDEQARRYYFTGDWPTSSEGIVQEETNAFRETYLLCALPKFIGHTADPYGKMNALEDLGAGSDQPAERQEKQTVNGMRQMLLRQFATDVIIRRTLHGEVAVIMSDLRWFASSLPHSTIYAVLRFWGIPEDWIDFFRKFLEAPLRMDASPGGDVRTRKRGFPITDAFEKLFGEVVLFCMDIAVNQLTGMTLLRFHDDLWLCGEPAQCADAWETIKSFVELFGLAINTKKTGSVYISDKGKDVSLAAKFPEGAVCMGMLQLTDTGEWSIDQKQVSAYVIQLQKQLGRCTSILEWIQLWNSCTKYFFQKNFGAPANCFGQTHVNSILETYAKMQRELFASHKGSVTRYLREQISKRFGVDDIPDPFFFLPEELGGLGLHNPFVPFFILKDQLMKKPVDRINKYLKADKERYKEKREEFGMLSDLEKHRRFAETLNASSIDNSILEEPFFSFEEHAAHREMYCQALLYAHNDLMTRPVPQDIQLTNETRPWFDELRVSHGMDWANLSSENKWIMHLYAEELRERFGALSIVDRKLLPDSIMKTLKKKKMIWQAVVWD